MAKTVTGFNFQTIPLEEARSAVLAGSGKYSELKEILINKLPTLAPNEAFTFGLPNGAALSDLDRKGISMALASTLRKAGIDWKITYSESKKVFICVPKKGITINSKQVHVYPENLKKQIEVIEFRNKVVELAKKGSRPAEIARLLNAKEARVNGVYYRYVKGSSK